MIITINTFLLSILCVVLCVFYIRKKNRKLHDFYRQFPRPKGTLPILGNVLDFRTGKDALKSVENYVTESSANGGDGLMSVQIGLHRRFVLVGNAEFAAAILSHPNMLNKPSTYNITHQWLGNGLGTASDNVWRQNRALLQTAFHMKILERFLDVFRMHAEDLVTSKFVPHPNLDVHPLVQLCTLDIICDTAMGITSSDVPKTHDGSKYVTCAKEICRLLNKRLYSVVGQWDFLYRTTSNYRQTKRIIRTLHNYTDAIIWKRRNELLTQTDQCKSTESKRHKVFLDLLLELRTLAGCELSYEQIRQEVDTFTFAGHDTTAITISFVLYNLAQYPEYQQSAYDEQLRIFGEDNAANTSYRISTQDLQKMTYLECVIKETLRMYPAGVLFGRIAAHDTNLCGINVPAGANLTICPYAIHRNPRYFPQPHVFQPNRFATNQTALFAFSAGPRNCIGKKYAMLEMKTIVSMVLRRYELFAAVPVYRAELAVQMVLTAINGVRIGLRVRQKSGGN